MARDASPDDPLEAVPEREARALPYEPDALQGISRQSVEWHHDSYYASLLKGRDATAKKLAEFIYSAGNRRDPAEAYTLFRGRLPTSQAMLKNRGLI